MKRSKNKKLNCWEFKNCGRRPGSQIAKEFGECPVSSDKRLNKVHGGKNAGRTCWVIAGTLCEGKIQGIFASKFTGCKSCDFYLRVKEEEGKNFLPPKVLLNKLK